MKSNYSCMINKCPNYLFVFHRNSRAEPLRIYRFDKIHQVDTMVKFAPDIMAGNCSTSDVPDESVES